jgi:hypothetical protein
MELNWQELIFTCFLSLIFYSAPAAIIGLNVGDGNIPILWAVLATIGANILATFIFNRAMK